MKAQASNLLDRDLKLMLLSMLEELEKDINILFYKKLYLSMNKLGIPGRRSKLLEKTNRNSGVRKI